MAPRRQLNIARLRAAVDAVVSRHSIIRPAFIDTPMGIFHAVMHHIDNPFSHISTEEDLTLYCDQVWQDGCTMSRTVNEVPVRFILVSRPSSLRHVLLVRLTHAQYDGFSMPILLADLSAAYADQFSPQSPPADFSQHDCWYAGRKQDDRAVSFGNAIYTARRWQFCLPHLSLTHPSAMRESPSQRPSPSPSQSHSESPLSR